MATPIRDCVGQRYGKLTVLRLSTERRRKRAVWVCACDCGKEARVVSCELWRQRSCGCARGAKTAAVAGYQFGAWRVLEQRGMRVHGGVNRSNWLAVCRCGVRRELVHGEWAWRWSCGCTPAPAAVQEARAVKNARSGERRKRKTKRLDGAYADRGSKDLRDHWERVLEAEAMPAELLLGAREQLTDPAVLDDAYNRYRLDGC